MTQIVLLAPRCPVRSNREHALAHAERVECCGAGRATTPSSSRRELESSRAYAGWRAAAPRRSTRAAEEVERRRRERVSDDDISSATRGRWRCRRSPQVDAAARAMRAGVVERTKRRVAVDAEEDELERCGGPTVSRGEELDGRRVAPSAGKRVGSRSSQIVAPSHRRAPAVVAERVTPPPRRTGENVGQPASFVDGRRWYRDRRRSSRRASALAASVFASSLAGDAAGVSFCGVRRRVMCELTAAASLGAAGVRRCSSSGPPRPDPIRPERRRVAGSPRCCRDPRSMCAVIRRARRLARPGTPKTTRRRAQGAAGRGAQPR